MSTRCNDNQMIKQWLECHPSALTRNCYRRDASRLLAHAGKPLNRIGLGDLQSFIQSLAAAGLAPISRARTIAAIKSLYGFCARMSYVTTNPTIELPLPRYDNSLAERILSEEDVQRLLSSETQLRDRVLLNLLYFGGLRVSENCNLRWRNLHARGEAGQITVFGKNGRTRAIPVPSVVWHQLTALRSLADANDAVFASRTGKPLDRGRVCKIIRDAAERAGITGRVSQPALATAWSRQPRARSRRAHPPGPSHPRSWLGSYDQPILAYAPRRLQRALPGPARIRAHGLQN